MRQQTVRSMTTKDSVGTLSVKCYETKTGNPKPVDFARLAQKEEKISSLQSSSPEVLICEGTIVCVTSNTAITFLARLDENMFAVENPQ